MPKLSVEQILQLDQTQINNLTAAFMGWELIKLPLRVYMDGEREVCQYSDWDPFDCMDHAWVVRSKFKIENGGSFIIMNMCDEYPEHIEISMDENTKVLVWAKEASIAVCQAVLLWINGHRGDFHPWTVFPELQLKFLADLGMGKKVMELEAYGNDCPGGQCEM